MKAPQRYTITAALPYANGPVHIGHLAGCYIPADIYVRFLRMSGKDVLFICGSDEHGVPITLKARDLGISPQEVVDRYHEMMKQSFVDFGIEFDHYSRTSAAIHRETAQEFFLNLYNKGEFTEQTTLQYFDEQEQTFLADRYIVGTCPNCGNDNAYGDQCEKCGKSLSPSDLISPRSKLSGSAPVKKETKHWFLPLDKYQREWIDTWIESKRKEWKPNVFGQCRSWLDQGLQPRAITRDLEWGVPVPLPGEEGKVLYVWFDAPIGYISASREWAASTSAAGEDAWKPYWQDEHSRLIHFIGKDNIVFHCIIFPAILKAHGDFILPEFVPANEFLNLEGDKISTSRNWAVWLHEYLQDFPGRQDELRYVLTSIAPETKDSDFSWKDYQQRVNSELADILGNFVNRVMVLTHKYFGGTVPASTFTPDAEVENVTAQYFENLPELMNSFNFRQAQFDALQLARAGNKYLADAQPWKMDLNAQKDEVAAIIAYSLDITARLSVALAPFLPETSARIRRMLNLPANFVWNDLLLQHLPEGHKVGIPEILFRKIEDSEIEKQLEKLKASREAQTVTSKHKPVKETITFDDFMKMDIRVGTILEAAKVEKADKLLQLTVDTGVDKRTVVSGIAEHFSPEEIIGRQVTILLNLAPRKIRGIESQGMILMAEDADGKLRFVQPGEEVNPGAEVR
ncbi:MAG: methionine--tRNA ligase [Bacteroidia bacterium]